MRRLGAGIAAACALSLCACPGGRGPGEPGPPGFRATADLSPLAEPAAPGAGKDGLAYLQRVYPRLRDPWVSFVNDCRLRLGAEHGLNRTSLRAVVELSVQRDGVVAASSVTTGSGEAAFDSVALEIARDASPYPPPPAELVSDDGLVHLSWAFHRDRRLAGVATADLRRVMWPSEKAIPAFLAAGNVEAAAARLVQALKAGAAGAESLGLGEMISSAAIHKALGSADASTRALGVDAAARARLTSAAPELEAIAGNATESALRRKAILALGAVAARGSKAFLLEIVGGKLSADDAAIVTAAMLALDAIGAGAEAHAALGARLAGAARERRMVLTVGATVPLPEAMQGLRALAAKGPRAVRAAACVALGTAASAVSDKADKGERAAAHKTMRKQLGARDAALRAACAHGAGKAGGKSRLTYWKLVALLKDRDERVRAEALRGAARLEPTRFGKELYVLRKERSPVVLAALAEALGRGGGAGAVERLIELAGREEVEIRRAAAKALAARKEPKAGQALAALIGDKDVEVRLVALDAPVPLDVVTFATMMESANQQLRAAALAKYFASSGRGETLLDFAERLAAAPNDAARALLAGVWLSR